MIIISDLLILDQLISVSVTLHDAWCPHSCMTVQKVPCLAPLCPEILAGALFTDIK